ncbi:FadR/GntR family transcriptional regulator [Rhizobium sp. 60-20]|jgi:GntR family galactonate operon transcriptional repressor|uniref:FadR/GntR family transcriptional regulator n=2 Tax=unclassified Rhizobium TaxID=2613769 RepID=UPI00064758D3|nr:FadR/GntR family transcriptional regulator [Rhizobium sp. 60-20]OJY63756.1 MAG: transcriptional regulator [Rhizobium sp. 60-20]RKD60741.1 GntR family transcriptional regulator [Rhizobium sp. WW_1]
MTHGQDAMTSRATPESKLIVIQSPFDAFVRKYGTIPRRGVFGHFVHELGRRIVRGDHPVGTTLPNEPDLVEQFGISRTVIREAMKCLAGKGLVEIKTRVGTRVKERSNWHHLDTDVMVWYYETGPSVEIMRSIKDLRLALEPEATARAALRRTESDIAAISAAYEQMASTIGDINSNADADLHFHTAIFAATHNMIYSQLIDLIAVGIYANRTLSGHEDIAEGQKRSLPFHKAILDAIVAQDADAALKASRNLLDAWLGRDYGF